MKNSLFILSIASITLLAGCGGDKSGCSSCASEEPSCSACPTSEIVKTYAEENRPENQPTDMTTTTNYNTPEK